MPSDKSQLDYSKRVTLAPQVTNRKHHAEEAIKHYIQSHRLQPDEKLPSIRALSEHLDISRDSTWRALQALQDEGWVNSLPNRRYVVSEAVYTEILRSLKIRVLFAGDKFIHFGGFRRLSDTLGQLCRFNNLQLATSLVPVGGSIDASVWDSCDVLLVDSDTSAQLLQQFKDFPVPVIGLDAAYSDRYYANIVTDHMSGGSMVADYMIAHGAQKVCVPYFRASDANPRVKSRINGFTQTWLESGRSEDSITTVPIPWSANNFQLSLNVKEYLEAADILPYYFVSDGRLAVSFLEMCDYLSISIPDEVKLIGYDGTQVGETTVPPMTTIQQHMEQMAEEVVDMIINMPHSDSMENNSTIIRLKPHLVVRGSS